MRVNITAVARVTSLLEQQTLTKERLEKHVQKNINRKNRGILWLKESWPYRLS